VFVKFIGRVSGYWPCSLVSSLSPGADRIPRIVCFGGPGEPFVIKKAVCMHEEDAGILWKHTEYRNGHAEVRRSRRLVLSFIATVVNYEYAFYWNFYQVCAGNALKNALNEECAEMQVVAESSSFSLALGTIQIQVAIGGSWN
jgi:Copper amine oxidase, enzyme domain